MPSTKSSPTSVTDAKQPEKKNSSKTLQLTPLKFPTLEDKKLAVKQQYESRQTLNKQELSRKKRGKYRSSLTHRYHSLSFPLPKLTGGRKTKRRRKHKLRTRKKRKSRRKSRKKHRKKRSTRKR